jgi:hypothetical protein
MYPAKKSRLVCQASKVGQQGKQVRPLGLWQPRAHPLLGSLPRGKRLGLLGRPSAGKRHEFLAPVLAGVSRHPAGVNQWAKIPRQGRLVERSRGAQIALANGAEVFQVAEERILRRPKPSS